MKNPKTSGYTDEQYINHAAKIQIQILAHLLATWQVQLPGLLKNSLRWMNKCENLYRKIAHQTTTLMQHAVFPTKNNQHPSGI